MSKIFHSYDPADGHRLLFDPLKAIIAPRPIGWISTVSGSGRANLAPYSYFNAFSNVPPILGFASQTRKDTLRNVEASGEFVFNLATQDLCHEMNVSSLAVDADVDEFELAGLRRLPSSKVGAPRVADSPVTMECKVTTILPLTDLDAATVDAVLVLGQVVAVHIDQDYLKDGLFDTAKARPLARCGYLSDYAVVESLFDLQRPDMPEDVLLNAARGVA